MSVQTLTRSDERTRLFRSLLVDHRQARADQVAALELADPNASDLDPGARLRALYGARSNLEEIREALLRVDTAAFGSCAGCEEPIPDERLLAVPWTRHCISCAVATQR